MNFEEVPGAPGLVHAKSGAREVYIRDKGSYVTILVKYTGRLIYEANYVNKSLAFEEAKIFLGGRQ